ncbi:MAG: DJ-1/PfpI/YhbO family deglycase/protease [Candidatus Riflebacteria bacterium]|nr:DJ-1/PfpI/YhbO family deglycase/protease [Candidatus Riflebacteria bacterium]
MKNKNIAILVAPKFQEDEVLSPRRHLMDLGAEVTLVGLHKGPCSSKGQTTVDVTALIDDVHQNQFDGLIIPGGGAPETLRQNKSILNFVRAFMQEARPVGAICHGPQVLISTGSTWCRSLTGYPGIKDDLINAGAVYLDQEVVVDGNLVTSRFPGDLPAFNKAFTDLLCKYDKVRAPWAHASPSQVIEYAILNEIKALALYENLAKKTKDKLSKAKFKFLAETERAHKERLERMYEFMSHGKKAIPRDLWEEGGESVDSINPDDDILKILKGAIAAEESANNLYVQIAEKMTNPEGRRMFLELAEDELSHRHMIEVEYATRVGQAMPSAWEKEPWWSEGDW